MFINLSSFHSFICSLNVCFDAVQLTAGSCRAKSAKSICLKNIMDVMFGGAAYYLLGWAFAYGDKTSCDADGVCSSIGNPFIGTEWFAMSETPYTSYATFYFQYVVSIYCHLSDSVPKPSVVFIAPQCQRSGSYGG